jgi:PhoH-like ATPase
VILVSKDINMRIKARALGLQAQDYFNDKVLEDTDLLYTGMRELTPDFWDHYGQDIESWKKGRPHAVPPQGPLCAQLLVNQFLFQEGGKPLHAIVRAISGTTAEIETLTDYTHPKNNVWGITARNREQNFALNLLMNPEIDFVTLLGQAGTGKTLLTLASGLTQVLESKTLQRDHHDPRHRSRRRGHRFPAGDRRRKNGSVDGRPRRQPRGTQQERRGCRRLGARGHP